MKKNLFLMMVALLGFGFVACDKDDETKDETVKNLKLDATVDGTKVSFTASAENAVSYSWDFGNGQSAQGATGETTYELNGEYYAKCTATGPKNKVTDSVKVEISGGREASVVEKILTGLTEGNNESEMTWYWGSACPMALSGGYKGHYFEHDSAMYDAFDAIDEGWWSSTDAPSAALNDKYTFKWNKSFDYVLDEGEDGFNWNWAWAAAVKGLTVSQYGDTALNGSVPANASWTITEYKHADYPEAVDAPKTLVNGEEVASAFVLTLNGGAFLGQRTGEALYQIMRIDQDTIRLRVDLAYPKDHPLDENWPNPEWITPGNGEWGYFFLVKNETIVEEEE